MHVVTVKCSFSKVNNVDVMNGWMDPDGRKNGSNGHVHVKESDGLREEALPEPLSCSHQTVEVFA